MEYYLDHAATTKPSQKVIEAITDCLTNHYGNPSSLHRIGLDAELLINDARTLIGHQLGAQRREELVFTSGATEASNLALRGTAAAYGKRRRHIVTSAVEHSSVRSTVDALEEQGFSVTRIRPREDGLFYAKDFADAVTADTCLLSMMLVENETGTILPVEEVFRKVKRQHPDVILHCDAVQAFLKLPIRFRMLGADLISVSAHKIHGPKGVGALYVRKGIRLSPIVTGGGQEQGLRPGTEAVPLIAGFAAAVQESARPTDDSYRYVLGLKEELWKALDKLDSIHFNSQYSKEHASPYIVNFSVEGIRSETMLHFLESKGIYVSSGSACSKGARSGVLAAYGIPDDRADSAIRVSFSSDTTVNAVYALAGAVAEGQRTLIHK